MPIVAFLFVAAEKAVLVFLGGQWVDAVPIFRALGPAAFIGTFNVATGWVYVSLGSTRRQFQWGLFATAVTVLAYLIGLPWGPIGVALAFSASLVVLRLPSVLYCFRGTHLTLEGSGDGALAARVLFDRGGRAALRLRPRGRPLAPAGGLSRVGLPAVRGVLYTGVDGTAGRARFARRDHGGRARTQDSRVPPYRRQSVDSDIS